MTIAYLALGSNLGDRLENLVAACRELESPSLHIQARSQVYEAQSVQGGGPGDFLNAALRIEWNGSARELLNWTQNVEEKLGRQAPPRHGPRTIDIDILLFGDETIHTPDLQIPHPRMMHRPFVLLPLCDVLPGGWVHEYSCAGL
jgi:2-amino-4-hydroxy-6-hydroxymethyldihydropteridine diphosphokinase